jgi:PKD domain
MGAIDADLHRQGRRRAVTRRIVLVIVGALALVHAAGSAPTWQAPVRLSPSDRALGPELGINPAGDAVVVWDHEQGADCPTQPASLSCIHIVEAASRSHGATTWQPPVEVARPGIGAAPKVAVDANGAATIIWVHDIGERRVLQATIRPPGAATWPNANDLSGTPFRIQSHQVGMDASGNAVTVWAQRDDADHFYVVGDLRPAAGGFWLAPVALSSPGSTATSGPSLALLPNGEALAAWIDGGAVRVARGQAAAGTWDPTLTPATGGVGGDTDVDVAMTAGGDAILAWSWRRSATGPAIVQAAFRPGGGNWGSAVDLGTAGTGHSHVQVAINDAGAAAVVWLDGTALRGAGRAHSTGAWSPATTIATNVADVGARLAMNPTGNAVVVWANKATGAIRAAIRPTGGAWQPPVRVSSPGSSDARVALDAASRAIAVWNRTAASPVVLAETADLSPNGPVLTAVTVPATARVGTTASFALARRAWASPLAGAPIWHFGDGKTATGTHVTHAYQATGTFTVTVSQGDTSGAKSTAVRHISVHS